MSDIVSISTEGVCPFWRFASEDDGLVYFCIETLKPCKFALEERYIPPRECPLRDGDITVTFRV